jgi:hypothetical protein
VENSAPLLSVVTLSGCPLLQIRRTRTGAAIESNSSIPSPGHLKGGGGLDQRGFEVLGPLRNPHSVGQRRTERRHLLGPLCKSLARPNRIHLLDPWGIAPLHDPTLTLASSRTPKPLPASTLPISLRRGCFFQDLPVILWFQRHHAPISPQQQPVGSSVFESGIRAHTTSWLLPGLIKGTI